MYIKSEATGQVYKVDSLPRFGGYEVVRESDYIAWCNSQGITPTE